VSELFPVLLPLLLVDALNPVLFALLIVATGSSRPVANSIAFLSGHTVAYFVAGIAFAIGLEQLTNRLQNPQPIDFFIELAIGVLFLWAALGARDGKASEPREPEGDLTPAVCFGYGAIVNFIGVPFALPYVAAIDQILKADLPVESSLTVLAIYNLAYAAPFVAVPVLVAAIGDSARPVLEKINNVLTTLVDRLMPFLLLLLGILISTDALKFILTGEPLW